jgi:hypothetical protein
MEVSDQFIDAVDATLKVGVANPAPRTPLTPTPSPATLIPVAAIRHATNDELEAYHMGRIPARPAEALRQHVERCAFCSARLIEQASFADAMRRACAILSVTGSE